MLSLEPLLPRYHFREQHRISIAAPAGLILDCVARQKAADDPLMLAAITLRELPARVLGRPRPTSFDLDDFTFLGRHGDSSVAYGLTGAFWQSDYGLVEVEDLAAFQRVNRRDVCQLVMGFETRFLTAGKTQLLTETRVCCPSAETRRRFAPYWYLIRPVSGLLRRRTSRAHGAPQTPQDLSQHFAVNYTSPGNGRPAPWVWEQEGKPQSVAMRAQVSANNAETYIACCLAGLGLIQIPAFDVREHLQSGELIEVLPDWPVAAMPVHIVYPHRRHLSRRVQVFSEWLQQKVSGCVV